MNSVAKLLIIDSDDKYLLLYRSNHPTFGDDPDLPGGTVEDGESSLEAMVREVQEEIGVDIDPNSARQLNLGTDYALFVTKVEKRPEITISWEHSSYEWLDVNEFIQKAENANDTYMHMVADAISKELAL